MLSASHHALQEGNGSKMSPERRLPGALEAGSSSSSTSAKNGRGGSLTTDDESIILTA